MVHETSGNNLRQARIAAGLTLEVAAVEAGCSVSTLQRAEAGTHRTRTDIIARLAGLYGVTLDALIHSIEGSAAPTGCGKRRGDTTDASKRSRVPAIQKEG